MKLIASLIFIAVSSVSVGQNSDLQERLQNLISKHSISESQLEKFAKIRSKDRWTVEKKQEKLAAKLADVGLTDNDIQLVICDLLDQGPQSLRAQVTVDNCNGYSNAYLELVAQDMFDSKTLNSSEFSLLRTIISAKEAEDSELLKQDIAMARERIKYMEANFYRLEDFETMRMFNWEGYLDFSADLGAIQDQLQNIGGVTWDAFNTYMVEHGAGLGRIANLQNMFPAHGPASQTALGFEFMEEIHQWRSYCLITEAHFKSKHLNQPYYWSETDLIKYREFSADPEIKKYLTQYMIIQHWYHRERKVFNDFNTLAQELKQKYNFNDPWHQLEKIEWEITTNLFNRFGFKMSNEQIIRDMGKDPFMAMLVLYRNDLPFIPEISKSMLEVFKKLDYNLLRLSKDEIEFLRMLGEMSRGDQTFKKVINHEKFEQFHSSKKLRFAMLLQMIRVGLASNREWFHNRPVRLYWEQLPQNTPIAQKEDGQERTKKLAEAKLQILEILDQERKGSKQFIIQYFPNRMDVFPSISNKAQQSIREILTELFPDSGAGLNYTRLSIMFMEPIDLSQPNLELEHKLSSPPDDGLYPYESVEMNEMKAPKPSIAPPPPPMISDAPPKVAAEIITFPDVEASFPGGAKAMKEFIDNAIDYPEAAKSKGDKGRVYLSFVVEVDGSLSNIKVERGISKELDQEAKRIIRKMPKWIPAEVNGNKIRCRAQLVIEFDPSSE